MLPPVNPFGAEFGDLHSTPHAMFQAELRACLVRNQGFAALSQDQVPAIYRSHLLGCLGDNPQRYSLSFPRLAVIKDDTVRRIQNEVLNKFPDWMISLGPECDE